MERVLRLGLGRAIVRYGTGTTDSVSFLRCLINGRFKVKSFTNSEATKELP